jgi:Fungal protein kinase
MSLHPFMFHFLSPTFQTHASQPLEGRCRQFPAWAIFGNSSPATDDTKWAQAAERLLFEEMRVSYRPNIQPIPSLVLQPGMVQGSYQMLYDGLLAIQHEMHRSMQLFTKTFPVDGTPLSGSTSKPCKVQQESDRQELVTVLRQIFELPEMKESLKNQRSIHYEQALTLTINCILKLASTLLGIEELADYRAFCSRQVTVDKVFRGDAMLDLKQDPDICIINVKEGEPWKKEGNKKQSVTFASIKSLGECKGIKQPKVTRCASDQLLSYVRQLVLADGDRPSEQAFTCCKFRFQFFHSDAEGMAISEPYDIIQHPFRFINHVLILSTFFTKDCV